MTLCVKIFIIFSLFKNSKVVRGGDARGAAIDKVYQPPPFDRKKQLTSAAASVKLCVH